MLARITCGLEPVLFISRLDLPFDFPGRLLLTLDS